MSEEKWLDIKLKISLYEKKIKGFPVTTYHFCNTDDLNKVIQSNLIDDLTEKIKVEDKLAGDNKAITTLENLIILQKWILRICRNFVSMPDLYDPEKRAMFEVGKHVIDGRVFNFNVVVDNPVNHSKIAKESGIFLAYSELSDEKTNKNFYILTPITSRHVGNLKPGKRGVFFDLTGKQWDSKIVAIVEHPLSLTQAMFAPFKRIIKLLKQAINLISGSSEKQLETQLKTESTKLEKELSGSIKVEEKVKAAKKETKMDKKDIAMTSGVTFAALGSSFAYISKTMTSLNFMSILYSMLVAIPLILIPTLIVAYFKLRARNLSCILEASGWAVNARMRLDMKLASVLSPRIVHPKSLEFQTKDMIGDFVEKATKPLDLISKSKEAESETYKDLDQS